MRKEDLNKKMAEAERAIASMLGRIAAMKSMLAEQADRIKDLSTHNRDLIDKIIELERPSMTRRAWVAVFGRNTRKLVKLNGPGKADM